MPNQNENLKNAVDRLFEMFQSQDFPEQLGWTIIMRRKDDIVPCMKYSLNNIMLLMLAGTRDGRPFSGWLKIGRVPRKGSHAIRLIAPLIVKEKGENGEADKEKLIGFRPFNVFAYEDTIPIEGDFPEVKPVDYTPEVIPELSQKIICALRKMGVTIEFRPIDLNPGALGYFRQSYNNGKGLIVLAENSPITIAHEGFHYLHSLEENINEVDDAKAEVVAELGAAILLSYEGVQGYEQQSWEYLKRYVKDAQNDKEVISRISSVLNLIEKCIQRLLTAIEEA